MIGGTAECLEKAFSDLPEANICRVGGDEFAISVVATGAQVEKCVKDFKEQIAVWRGGHVKDLSAAVGYASIRDYPGLSIMALQGKADEKMYEDKKAYYNRTGYDRRSSR